MVRERTNAIMIMEEDIESLLAEWDRVPNWIKVHVGARRPAHRYEGQLLLDDEGLVFMGRDMKEGRPFEMDIALDSVMGVGLGFSHGMQASIDAVFGSGGPVPFIVDFRENGQTRRAFFSTCADNYPAHMNMNNVRWYEMLGEIIAKRERRGPAPQRERVLVLAR